MENRTLFLEIVTPDGLIFSGNVKEVLLPGEEGEFGVLPEHISLFTLLDSGIIEWTTEADKKDAVVINAGNVTLADGKVTALVDGAVSLNSESETGKTLENVKTLLKDVSNSNQVLVAVESRLN